MKGWIARTAALALFAALMGSASPVAAEPTYACTAATEGHLFQVAYDHPYDPGSFYQCRAGAWRLIGVCTPSHGCPPPPDPNGPIVEV
ncbi:hypothetical protein K4L06_04780 [Lysobacter sp. BMK333-48F3]|uniref:hypothetical protein n=1 Tax=Lysobacter sp. BMK333-48F3 TaxID=2867962 RepID=UPI001C8BAA30|nr:hypothetical protein [Lysobacter sp. BMK333-48F3]MBX9400616.1 hypothetical protein [Lysobacter sp. BMK333-48F3]